MSKDSSSSSSSEDEEQSAAPAVQESEESQPETSRFQCPPDFVPCSYKPCKGTRKISSDSEIWLIKAPSNFNPQSFSGVKLNLRGLERVSVPLGDGTEQAYNVLSAPTPCPELRLMVPPGKLGPSFSGIINISETSIDHGSDRALHVIPAIPPPSIPPGLKQRFQHYQAPVVSSCQADEEEEEVPRKKKKKKEKRIKSEPQEASNAAMPLQTEMVIKTEVKEEPMDTGFGDHPELHKKKKKKKKSKSAEESL